MIVAQDRNKPTVIGNERFVLWRLWKHLQESNVFWLTDAAQLKLPNQGCLIETVCALSR